MVVVENTFSHEMVSSGEIPLGSVGFDPGDPYTVLGLLGQGGAFGATVAAGLERKTGKKVAIKHIYPIATDRASARHILREVTIMRLLRCHPSVSVDSVTEYSTVEHRPDVIGRSTVQVEGG